MKTMLLGMTINRVAVAVLGLLWLGLLCQPGGGRACRAFSSPWAHRHSARNLAPWVRNRRRVYDTSKEPFSNEIRIMASSVPSVAPPRFHVRWPWTRRTGHIEQSVSMETENITSLQSIDRAVIGSNDSFISREVAWASQSNAELFPFSTDGRREFAIARKLSTLSTAELIERGWAHALSSGPFNVYTQTDPSDPSLLRFLVIGRVDGASPRSSMYSFINGDCRVKWDAALKSLLCIPSDTPSSSSPIPAISADTPLPGSFSHQWPSCHEGFDDVLYYRAKFPWPMKDRDYYMNRRCRVFEGNRDTHASIRTKRGDLIDGDCSDVGDAGAVVSAVASEGTEIDVPSGTMRMHRYRGITAFLAASDQQGHEVAGSSGAASSVSASRLPRMDRNGTIYVALSVDDQVLGSKAVVSMLSSVAARLVPEYLDKMFAVAKDIEASRNRTESDL